MIVLFVNRRSGANRSVPSGREQTVGSLRLRHWTARGAIRIIRSIRVRAVVVPQFRFAVFSAFPLFRSSAFPETHTHASPPRLLLPLAKRRIDDRLLNRVGNGTTQRTDLLIVARRIHAIRQQHY